MSMFAQHICGCPLQGFSFPYRCDCGEGLRTRIQRSSLWNSLSRLFESKTSNAAAGAKIMSFPFKDYADATRGHLNAMLQELDPAGASAGIDERFEALLNTLERMTDGAAAVKFGERIKQKFETHLLCEWAKGKIEGKLTVEACERKARAARGLADMLAEKGNAEGAGKQIARAVYYEEKAEELKQ